MQKNTSYSELKAMILALSKIFVAKEWTHGPTEKRTHGHSVIMILLAFSC